MFPIGAFMAVNEISFFLSYMIFKLEDKVFRLWDWEIVSERMFSLEVYYVVSVIIVIGLNALRCVAASALLYFSLKRIVRGYREKDYCIHRTELLFILAPALVSLMIRTLLRVTVETTESSIPELLYDRYPLLITIVPVILLFSIMSGVKLFQDMIGWNREKSSRIILEKQVSSLQEHMGRWSVSIPGYGG